MNPIRFALIKCLSMALVMNSQLCRAATDSIPLLDGATLVFSAPLTPKEQKVFGSGWKVATYMDAEGSELHLFPLEKLTPVGGVIFGNFISRKISPTGKYVVIDVLRAGLVDPGFSGKPEVQSRQYCPVLEAKTGCIVSNQSGELCEGQWQKQEDRWIVPGLTDDANEEMLKHQFDDANTLWRGYVNSLGKPFHLSIREAISSNFGIRNLMACDHPRASNVASYKNIASELKKVGDFLGSEYVEKRVRDIAIQRGRIEYGAKVASDCPVVNIENNVFDASLLERNSRVSIENGTDDYPIVLDFYRVTREGCRKTEFARYPIEGGSPTVESIFFMPLHGRVNVFSIVAWDINNRGDGTYGRLYQVYAYFLDKNGVLVENTRVSEDNSMTGIDGYAHGAKSKFRYGTASDVKRYWRSRLR